MPKQRIVHQDQPDIDGHGPLDAASSSYDLLMLETIEFATGLIVL